MTFLERFPGRMPVVIAELGAKYAPMPVMKEMVNEAAACGADVVKFQTYSAETIATPGSFFTFDDGRRVSQYEFFKKYELTLADHEELNHHCGTLHIPWISTPSHTRDLELLERFNPIAYKTGSDDLTNIPFLRSIAACKRSMIISTGMSTLSEIECALEAVVSSGCHDIILLHCVVSYPSRPEVANLRAIETLRHAFGFPVGLSDHTPDELTSLLAVQLGAVVIEKHFTLDHKMQLPDHEASLDPGQFRTLVERVRLVEKALGDGVKRILPTEEKWRMVARKSIFAKRKIAKGQVLTADDLDIRRPGNGLHPHMFDQILGSVAECNIEPDTLLDLSMLRF